jgi:glyoxylase-like metal-dependent hydrolase (beta-lactamase superfamily II)
MPAEVKILIEGTTTADTVAKNGDERTRPTISLIRDKDIVMVVDPGVLENQEVLVKALLEEGLGVNDINIVCITHSHIDHYRNIGMFPKAKTLEYYGLWEKESVQDWQEWFSENIQILRTPGHDKTSITFFVKTADGIVAVCGDVFWKEDHPQNDIYASDPIELEKSRDLVLKMADWIIPGHGPMYKVNKSDILIPKKRTDILKDRLKKTDTICRKCRRRITEKEKCLCRTYLCLNCCKCGLDCDLCGCSHKRKL